VIRGEAQQLEGDLQAWLEADTSCSVPRSTSSDVVLPVLGDQQYAEARVCEGGSEDSAGFWALVRQGGLAVIIGLCVEGEPPVSPRYLERLVQTAVTVMLP